MRLFSAALCALLLSVATAQAAPVTGAAREAFAGGWRAGSCSGPSAQPYPASFTLEFAMTGGMMTIDTGDEGGGQQTVGGVDVSGSTVTLTLNKTDKWVFTRKADGSLVADKPIAFYVALTGKTFRLCHKAADRSAIHLTAAQAGEISGAMPGGPYLIDLRARKGCSAIEYQYLNFDLVGPTAFELHRWNSSAVGEKLAVGGKLGFAVDEISNFRIEKADAVAGGYRFTITELIPPNGSRGDTTTITVLLNKKAKTATIPEWKRTYALCDEPIP